MLDALSLVRQEVERQDQAGYQLEPWPNLPCPVDLNNVYEDERFYLPRLEVDYPNSIFVSDNREFLEVLSAIGVVSNVLTDPKENTDLIRHENQHADVLRYMGQENIRMLIRLHVGRVGLQGLGTPDVQLVRPIGIDAATIMEDVDITKLGMALTLAAPDKPSSKDQQNIAMLGYTSPAEVKRRAKQYGVTRYPI